MEVIKSDFVILKDTKLSTNWDQMVLFNDNFVSGSNWDGKPVTETTLSNNVWATLWGGGFSLLPSVGESWRSYHMGSRVPVLHT